MGSKHTTVDSLESPLKKTLFGSFIVMWLIGLFAFVIGYVNNIIWLIHSANLSEMDPQTVVALIGVVIPPLGMIHGWIVMF